MIDMFNFDDLTPQEDSEQLENMYPELVASVMEHIITMKEKKRDAPLIDLIGDYCFRNNVPLELVGDAIASDEYFKSFIEADCIHHNIIRGAMVNLEEW